MVDIKKLNKESKETEEIKTEDLILKGKTNWLNDIRETLIKAANILPAFRPIGNATYKIKILGEIEEIHPENPKFSDVMFVIKIEHEGMTKSFNVTSKSARLALAKLSEDLKTLIGKTILVQKQLGKTKFGENYLYSMQLIQ